MAARAVVRRVHAASTRALIGPRGETPHDIAIGSTRHQSLAVLQDQHVVTLKPRLDLLDARDIHYHRSMDPHELLGRQPLLDPVQRFANTIRLLGRLHEQDLVGHLDAVDRGRVDQNMPVVDLQGDTVWRTISSEPVEQRLEAPRKLRRSSASNADDRTFHRRSKPSVVKGFEQIVDRVHVERLERISLVRRHEDDRGHAHDTDSGDDTEAVEARHLYVEKYDVGPELPDRVDGRLAARRIADELQLVHLGQQRSRQTPGRRFVVHDQHAAARTHRGRTMRTRKPPPGALDASNDCLSPYRASSRSRTFLKPRPATCPSCPTAPRPLSAMSMCSEPPETRAATVTLPPRSCGSIPCWMAFSRQGCRIMLGTRIERASSSTAHSTVNRSPKRAV